MLYKNKTLVATGLIASLSLAFIPAFGFAATDTSGNAKVQTEIAASIAMKIVSPNDVNPDCLASDPNGDVVVDSNDTYGVVNRYASSTGEGGKVVDTFNGNEGEKDELNENTSCAKLSMTPNTFDSTYSDVTVYTNSPTGYALSVKSAEGVSPNLVNVEDNNEYIPAGILEETDGEGEQAGTKIVKGGQNKWSIKASVGVLDEWTAVTSSDQAVRSYDQETSGGSTTRMTYGISTGTNPAGTYATTLTYTATMFDGYNPAVPSAVVSKTGNATLSTESLAIPYGETRTLTITPDEGYYLTSLTCSEGYTCSTPNTGSANNPTAASMAAQTIDVTNNNTTSNGAVSVNLSNLYRISFTKSNISSPSTAYIDVPYGGQTTVTVTPASGYYLSGFSGCPSGWSCTGVSTGTSYTGSQTLTLANNNSTDTGILTLTGTISDPYASCGTTAGSTCTVNGVALIRLKDGHLWTKSSQGLTTWNNLSSVSCPSGMSKPTAQVFDTLLAQYGGYSFTNWGTYGYQSVSGALYQATGWYGRYWSSTENGSSYAYYMSVTSSNTAAVYYDKTERYYVVCYR